MRNLANGRIAVCDGIDYESGRIWGRVVSADGETELSLECTVTPEEYATWGADDDYPTLLLMQKSGLSLL